MQVAGQLRPYPGTHEALPSIQATQNYSGNAVYDAMPTRDPSNASMSTTYREEQSSKSKAPYVDVLHHISLCPHPFTYTHEERR